MSVKVIHKPGIILEGYVVAVQGNGERWQYEKWVYDRWCNGTLGDRDLAKGFDKAVEIHVP